MNSINITYNNLLGNEKPENFERYFKTLLEENVQNVVFTRPPARNQPERVCSSNICGTAIDSFNNSPDDFNIIFQAAKMIIAILGTTRITILIALDYHWPKRYT